MIELFYEYLYVPQAWLCVLIMSCTRFRLNPYYIYLNVNELLCRNRSDISILSNSNGTRTHNHLIRKRKLNYLAKLAKWLSCFVSTYLYGAYDYVFV